MRIDIKKKRNKRIAAEFKKLVRRGMALGMAERHLAEMYDLDPLTIHRIRISETKKQEAI